MAEYDSPWKELLDQHLPLALALLFPDVEQDIDWSQDYESLEQELRKLAPEGETGKRLADKLVKVRTRAGDERYLHVEVQGQPQEGFERRVYVYHYRADDRFGLPVDSLVILADDDPDWRPPKYVVELKRTRLTFEFRPVKILDLVGREAELEGHANVVGLFLVAHLKSRQTREDPEERARVKLGLILKLHERKLEAEELRQWYRLLDWLLDLPAELEAQVWQEVRRQEQEKQMPFITFAERYGREQGREEGERLGLLKALGPLLKKKFGEEGAAFFTELERQEKLPALQAVLTVLIETDSGLDELRRLLP
jgi:hypothetical protein